MCDVIDASSKANLDERRIRSLKTNGFVRIRGLLSADRAAEAASALKAEVDEIHIGRSIADACAKLNYPREFFFDERMQEAIRSVLPRPRFLQVCDVQLDHNRQAWHRDSACRTFNKEGDWDVDAFGEYAVYKIIVYLECGYAGLAVIPGSHDRQMKVLRADQEDFRVLEPGEDAPERFEHDKNTTAQWIIGMTSGDALIFDERLLHCGRRYDETQAVAERFLAAKSTLAYAFGGDDRHSWRFYSYFRYLRRELKFQDLPEAFVSRLTDAGTLPKFYGTNLFEAHPGERQYITGK